MLVMSRVFAFAMMLGAATAKAAPSIVRTTADSSGIAIVFDTPMVTWTRRDDAPATLTPPLACDWAWQDDTTLHCAATDADPLRPATHYAVHFTESLWLQTGERYLPPDTGADYERPGLVASASTWIGGRPVLELQPTAPVDIAAVRDVLRARLDDGSEVSYELAESRPGYGYRYGVWRLSLPPIAGNDLTVALHLDAGLRSTAGALRGIAAAQPLVVARVNESFRLRGATCGNTGYAATPSLPTGPFLCDARTDIGLVFSQRLSTASLEALKALLPTGSTLREEGFHYGWSPVSQPFGLHLTLRLDTPNTTTRLDLPATLVSTDGAALVPTTFEIRTGDYPPSTTAAPPRVLGLPGAILPRVTATSVVDAAVSHVEIDGGGARRIPGAKADAQRREIVLQPPALSRGLRRGGLVYGEVDAKRTGEGTISNRYVAAFAPFDVTAARVGRQFVVWVTQWKNAKPIPGAGVEIVCYSGTLEEIVLATGMTDATGVALTTSTAPAACTDSATRLVRVRDGRDVAILPLDSELANGDFDVAEGDYRAVTPEGKRVGWGVSDKPIYRVGETVRYRVWLRERRRNRLVPVDAGKTWTLEFGQWHQALQTWDVTLDAFGAAAGEFTLPRTLDDGDYCIRFDADDADDAGACFTVAAFRANELQVTMNADRVLVRRDDEIGVDAAVSYYSGGGAAGSAVTWEATIEPTPFEAVHEQWRGFAFISSIEDPSNIPPVIRAAESSVATTDAQGRAQARLQLRMPGGKPPPALAVVRMAAQAGAGPMRATSDAVTLHWAQYLRYVGLRIPPAHDPASRLTIDAVVIDADGNAIEGANVDVEVRPSGDDTAAPLAHCSVVAGKPAPCAPGLAAGRYGLVARSGDAAPAQLQVQLVKETPPPVDAAPAVSLSLVESPHGARADLTQPFRRARVLFTVEHGEVMDYWTATVDAPTTRIDIPRDPRWAPGYTLRAIVIDAETRAVPREKDNTLTATLRIPVAATPAPPIGLQLDKPRAAPGETVVATLHNGGDRAVQVTVAVVDDAVRALAGDRVARVEPGGDAWLGRLGIWETANWSGFGAWPGRSHLAPVLRLSGSDDDGLETIVVTGSRIRRVDLETSSPAFVIGKRGGEARVRHDFTDSALWQPGIVLQPGERRDVPVVLPDNLTRWRVLAWSNDTGDAFALAQATVEAQSALELRLAVPTRAYIGDRAVLGVSVGNRTDGTRTIDATVAARGAGVDRQASREQPVAARAQATLDLAVSASKVGSVEVAAQAQGGDARDAVAASFEVATTQARERSTQAGWIGATPLRLALPPLPAGAHAPSLRLTIARGPWALAEHWIVGLRDYPHRCWEQTLSRAVGAAVAIRLGLAPRLWPDAATAIREAFEAAPAFQENGRFHYFRDAHGGWPASPTLTAYTVRAFALLRELGHAAPEPLQADAERALASWYDGRVKYGITDEAAAMLGALAPTNETAEGDLRLAWSRRDTLSWYGHAELARALAANEATRDMAAGLLEEIRAATDARGPRLVLRERDLYLGMGSRLRDQCSAVDALLTLDPAPGHPQAQALLAGLVDLYAGGMPLADTQASAQCLVALLHAAPPSEHDAVATLVADGREFRVDVKGGEAAQWAWPDKALPAHVELRASGAGGMPLGYTLDIGYDRDQRGSEPAATGFVLRRRYAVLRDGAWQPLPAAGAMAGDWVRVTLTLTNTALRRFVAVTDTVPGGLRPADLSFDGVATPVLRALAAGGDWWFGARRIDERNARFYAEYLGPGSHEIHYYARAQFSGTWFAPPARAELMYGTASAARTAPVTVVVQAEPSR